MVHSSVDVFAEPAIDRFFGVDEVELTVLRSVADVRVRSEVDLVVDLPVDLEAGHSALSEDRFVSFGVERCHCQ